MSAHHFPPCSPALDPQPGGAADLRTSQWSDTLKDGTGILIRALEPKDRGREFEFIKGLSPESRHFRFLATMNEPGEGLLDQLLDIDYQQRMAYVALSMKDGLLTEVGVARYASMEAADQCECAVVVADQWQRKHVGKLLMKHLIDAARVNGFKRMVSMDSAMNAAMRYFASAQGFSSQPDPQDTTQVLYTLALT